MTAGTKRHVLTSAGNISLPAVPRVLQSTPEGTAALPSPSVRNASTRLAHAAAPDPSTPIQADAAAGRALRRAGQQAASRAPGARAPVPEAVRAAHDGEAAAPTLVPVGDATPRASSAPRATAASGSARIISSAAAQPPAHRASSGEPAASESGGARSSDSGAELQGASAPDRTAAQRRAADDRLVSDAQMTRVAALGDTSARRTPKAAERDVSPPAVEGSSSLLLNTVSATSVRSSRRIPRLGTPVPDAARTAHTSEAASGPAAAQVDAAASRASLLSRQQATVASANASAARAAKPPVPRTASAAPPRPRPPARRDGDADGELRSASALASAAARPTAIDKPLDTNAGASPAMAGAAESAQRMLGAAHAERVAPHPGAARTLQARTVPLTDIRAFCTSSAPRLGTPATEAARAARGSLPASPGPAQRAALPRTSSSPDARVAPASADDRSSVSDASPREGDIVARQSRAAGDRAAQPVAPDARRLEPRMSASANVGSSNMAAGGIRAADASESGARGSLRATAASAASLHSAAAASPRTSCSPCPPSPDSPPGAAVDKLPNRHRSLSSDVDAPRRLSMRSSVTRARHPQSAEPTVAVLPDSGGRAGPTFHAVRVAAGAKKHRTAVRLLRQGMHTLRVLGLLCVCSSVAQAQLLDDHHNSARTGRHLLCVTQHSPSASAADRCLVKFVRTAGVPLADAHASTSAATPPAATRRLGHGQTPPNRRSVHAAAGAAAFGAAAASGPWVRILPLHGRPDSTLRTHRHMFVIGSVLRTGFWSWRLTCKSTPTCSVPVGLAPGFSNLRAIAPDHNAYMCHFKWCRCCVCHRDTIDLPCTVPQASSPSQDRHGWDAFWGWAQFLGTCPIQADVICSRVIGNGESKLVDNRDSRVEAARHTMVMHRQAQGGSLKNKFLLIKRTGEIVSSRAVLCGDMNRLRLVSDEDKDGQCVVSDTFAEWRSGAGGSAANFQLKQCCKATVGLLRERLELPGCKDTIARFVLEKELA